MIHKFAAAGAAASLIAAPIAAQADTRASNSVISAPIQMGGLRSSQVVNGKNHALSSAAIIVGLLGIGVSTFTIVKITENNKHKSHGV